jgi:hypothetical protein
MNSKGADATMGSHRIFTRSSGREVRFSNLHNKTISPLRKDCMLIGQDVLFSMDIGEKDI